MHYSINIYGREKQENTDTNNRNMYEIITSVNNIDVLVTKVKITKTSEYNLPVLSKIMAEASRAKDNLSALPVNQSALNNVSKFFTQVISFTDAIEELISKCGVSVLKCAATAATGDVARPRRATKV